MLDQRVHILTSYLVLRVQGGEPEALGELFELWTVPLQARARRLLGDDAAATDITQEVWLGIARGIRTLRDPDCFGPWAMRIVHHKCADEIHRRVRDRQRERARPADAQSSPAPDQNRVNSTPRRAVREAICLLPTKYREVIMLYYMDSCTVETIALVLNAPVGTVKSRLRRARTQLKPALERSHCHG